MTSLTQFGGPRRNRSRRRPPRPRIASRNTRAKLVVEPLEPRTLLSTIAGRKFNDLDGNGTDNGGSDLGLSGWTFFLDSDGDDEFDAGEITAVSGLVGAFSFEGLAAGSYRVREILEAGWLRTTVNPADVVVDGTADASSIDFGNFKLVSIVGTTYDDLNGDGILQAGESGVVGRTMFLDTDDNGSLDVGESSTTTDGNGTFVFVALGPGTYRVREMLDSSLIQTTANPDPIIASSGVDTSNVLFGNFERFSIGGQIFEDRNGNGAQNAGDAGLAGWTVFLDTDGDGALGQGEPSMTTGANGSFTFADLGPGTYTVREVSQAGWLQTSANPAAIVGLSGTDVLNVQFGNFDRFTISGRKFHDLNGDATDAAGADPGLGGWTIFLDANNNGSLDSGESSTTTAADGTYSFADLGPGTYRVREVPQSGWIRTTPNPNLILGSSGLDVSGMSFGNFQLITISGVAFNDLDGDGQSESGEPGLQGWTIFLDSDDDGVLDANESRTLTVAGGGFTFESLGPGTHRLREAPQVGWMRTTANPADIVAASGMNVTGVAFGNLQFATIGGKSFHDLNGDGELDTAEPGLQGWTIFIDSNSSGALDPGESSATTAADGSYSFSGLLPGTYRVRAVAQTGWLPTTAPPAEVLAMSGTAATIHFGNFRPITISGRKFLDLDGDGAFDAGEPGLRGWTIFLDTNDNGTSDVGETNTITGADGIYTIPNLGPGTYRVREVLQSGWTRTTANPAAVTATSGANPAAINLGNRPGLPTLIVDPVDPAKTAILVVGTAGNDKISASRQKNGSINLRVGKVTTGPFNPSGRLLVYGLEGNDSVSISSKISVPAELHGGEGDDALTGGAGHDLLLGEAGNDRLTGGRGRDFLIGGDGTDRVSGIDDDDMVVAGTTDFDTIDSALRAILAEWTSNRGYTERVGNIRTGQSSARLNELFFLNSNTVHDDAAVDSLTGGAGLDWFFLRLSSASRDNVTDSAPGEISDAIQ